MYLLAEAIKNAGADWLPPVLFIIPFAGPMFGALFLIERPDISDGMKAFLVGAPMVIGFTIGFIIMIPIWEDENALREMGKERIFGLECDQMREELLWFMQDENAPYYLTDHEEFQRNYYYTKCEIPLRDEVMKLQ